ncbi:MAG: hypothetical protein BroJett041_19040 [Candidatus Jettenia caeni]|nr:MAG: hypothetical protein BroJett041_19040 [Candidatus Jettenia caeni]GJQ46333.1 MAG: hypothetical protein JETCAE04_20870 [Candidatus Jettenia caeni]
MKGHVFGQKFHRKSLVYESTITKSMVKRQTASVRHLTLMTKLRVVKENDRNIYSEDKTLSENPYYFFIVCFFH